MSSLYRTIELTANIMKLSCVENARKLYKTIGYARKGHIAREGSDLTHDSDVHSIR